MKKEYILIALVVIAVLVAGFKLQSGVLGEKKTADVVVPPEGPITVLGSVVCLPHKDTSGPQTLECAFGFLDDEGRYFALRDTDPEHRNVAGAPMGRRMVLRGTFKLQPETKYQNIGVVEVRSITPPGSGNGTAEVWGTVYGTALLGPSCPVVMDPPAEECADRPYKTTLIMTKPDGSGVVKEFSTGADGKFSVEIAPGEYAIRTAVAANVLPYCQSQPFTVTANEAVEVAVSCDTGIR